MKTRDDKQQAYTLVVGMGVTGMSVLRYLHGRESLVLADSRDAPPNLDVVRRDFRDVPVHTGAFEPDTFLHARRIILSPGIALAQPVVAAAQNAGIEILGDIDLFAGCVDAPVVGITGSNGKSTVTTLVAEMARTAGRDAAAGGNIGTPALDLLQPRRELYVLELSSFQLETLHHLDLAAAVVLNVSEDHMDRYPDIDSYAASKKAIYRHCKVAVVNRDDARTAPDAVVPGRVIGFTLSQPQPGDFGRCKQGGSRWLCRGGVDGDEMIMPVSALKIAGRHNVANALAALALGEAIGLPRDAMVRTLESFPGLPHRTQWVADIRGVSWYNDSKGTNVGATLAAIRGLPGQHVLIAGGRGKGADFSPLREVAADRLRAAVLIGEDATAIAKVLGDEVPVYFARNMQQAVQMAADVARKGDNVLLSPACASFDMFSGFEHRGNVFMDYVRELEG